ncbi:MAG: LexA family transcriptional regulator [Clostridia bacterium]|nr:LexA family transcriptional regulator [Clostridia bacterium]
MIFKTAEKSKIILDYVNEYYDENYRSPSLRDIEAATGIPRATVGLYLNHLREEGVILYDGKKETIITDYIESLVGKKTEKLNIIGKVVCGNPVSETQTNLGTIDFPISLLGSGKYFVLKAYGDSMNGAGIEEDDLVIVRQQAHAEYGQIVVAIDDKNENTLKRYLYDNESGRPYLHPENEKYPDIYSDEISIQGVAVKVIKSLE